LFKDILMVERSVDKLTSLDYWGYDNTRKIMRVLNYEGLIAHLILLKNMVVILYFVNATTVVK
jgi:hypothetical protein